MSDPVRVIDFPDEWGTANPVDHIAGYPLGMGPDDGFYIFGCLLEDGSNLYALIYPGGYRFVRTAMYIGWGIEERYGPAPKPQHAKRVHAIRLGTRSTRSSASKGRRPRGNGRRHEAPRVRPGTRRVPRLHNPQLRGRDHPRPPTPHMLTRPTRIPVEIHTA